MTQVARRGYVAWDPGLLRMIRRALAAIHPTADDTKRWRACGPPRIPKTTLITPLQYFDAVQGAVAISGPGTAVYRLHQWESADRV